MGDKESQWPPGRSYGDRARYLVSGGKGKPSLEVGDGSVVGVLLVSDSEPEVESARDGVVDVWEEYEESHDDLGLNFARSALLVGVKSSAGSAL